MKALSLWLALLQNTLKAAYTRAPVLLQGSAEMVQQQLNTVRPPENTLWLKSSNTSSLIPPQSVQIVQPNQAQHWLGSEQQMLIVDGFSGVDPNMLLALAGTLQAGGVLLLLMPPLPAPNPALGRFLSTGQRLADQSRFFQHLVATPGLLRPATSLPALSKASPPQGWTPEQQRVLAEAALWSAEEIVLIQGRRGRGKSTLLGELIHRTEGQMILITNHRSALTSLLHQLKRHQWQAERGVSPFFSNSVFSAPGKTLKIMPPDAFLQQKPAFDTLFIDEAARLTLPVLQKLLSLPGRKVLATTQEGYEGAGQGLRLKLNVPIRSYTLTMPTRWRTDDLLEQFLDRALRLNISAPLAPRGNWQITPWQPDLHDMATLDAVYHLLKLAHYQTRPSDLMQLLDAPGQYFWLARCNGIVAGVLWAVEEGGLAQPPAHVRGHLAAQRLAQLEGDRHWLRKHSLRITRIGVHPARQGEGIGSALVVALKKSAKADYLSVSCAADPQVLRFWQKQGFIHHSTGQKPNRASGLPSALLYFPLT